MMKRIKYTGLAVVFVLFSVVSSRAAEYPAVYETSFENFTLGHVKEFSDGNVVWAGQHAQITRQRSHTGVQSLHLTGGKESVIDITLAGPLQNSRGLQFYAERWTRDNPFECRVSVQQTNEWKEISVFDQLIMVGTFNTELTVKFPEGKIEAVRITCVAPLNKGVLIDDVRLLKVAPENASKAPTVASEPIKKLLQQHSLFVSGTHDTHTFRIPAIITALNGDLIAACDARRDHGGDLLYAQNIDIAFRRSTDNGETWSEIEFIAKLGEGRPASDPSLILDHTTGEIFCFYNYMDQKNAPKEFRLWVQTSNDHGKTWGEPRDITDEITPPEWKMDFKFITSGRGIQTRDGVLLHTMVNLKNGLRVFGSKDHGKSWFLLPSVLSPGDESKIVMLADGRLMVNCRVNGYGRRYVHVSEDGGLTWKGWREEQLVDPGCNGAILRYTSVDNGYRKNRLLFCNANSFSGRNNLAMRISYDEGETWSDGKVIDAGPSAYSDMTICADGHIGILYEPGHGEVRFVKISLEDLTDGSDQLTKPYKVKRSEKKVSMRENDPTSREKPTLAPVPQSVTWGHKTLPLDAVRYVVPPLEGMPKERIQLIRELESVFNEVGVAVEVQKAVMPVVLRIAPVDVPLNADEAYRLVINPQGVALLANDIKGLYYGVQTLRQLLVRRDGVVTAAMCDIIDYPAYGIRGFMLDTASNYRSIQSLHEQIDLMAMFKMNTFHWQLSNDETWRLQSLKYPELTATETNLRQPNMFYTQQEFRDFVDYCRDRQIRVIPELATPSHSGAFRRAVGIENMKDPRAKTAIVEVMQELCALVPKNLMPFIQIGSSQPTLIEERADGEYMALLLKTVRNQGRDVIGWWPGLAQEDDVHQILQMMGAAEPRKGNRHIDSRVNELNHLEALDVTARIFSLQPCGADQSGNASLGGILTHQPSIRIADETADLRNAPVVVGTVAYADRLWSGVEKDLPDYRAGLPPVDTPDYASYVAFENRLAALRDRFFADKPFFFVKSAQIPWRLLGPVGDNELLELQNQPLQETYEANGTTWNWSDPVYGGTVHVRHFQGFKSSISKFVPGKNIVWAHTYIYSDQDQEVGAWIGFNTPSTSDYRVGAARPESWNVNPLCNIWINGNVVTPPEWKNIGVDDLEKPLSNEIYTAREPTRIHLKKGWNTVLVRTAPRWKWCFSFAPVDWNGTTAREVEGLRFAASLEADAVKPVPET